MVIYEWADAQYLGKTTGSPDAYFPVSELADSWSYFTQMVLHSSAENICLHSPRRYGGLVFKGATW
jgi:hypothetical protein